MVLNKEYRKPPCIKKADIVLTLNWLYKQAFYFSSILFYFSVFYTDIVSISVIRWGCKFVADGIHENHEN